MHHALRQTHVPHMGAFYRNALVGTFGGHTHVPCLKCILTCKAAIMALIAVNMILMGVEVDVSFRLLCF